MQSNKLIKTIICKIAQRNDKFYILYPAEFGQRGFMQAPKAFSSREDAARYLIQSQEDALDCFEVVSEVYINKEYDAAFQPSLNEGQVLCVGKN